MVTGKIPEYVFGSGAVAELPALLERRRPGWVLWLVDEYFRNYFQRKPKWPGFNPKLDHWRSAHKGASEPTVSWVDGIVRPLRELSPLPVAVMGVGGGSTLDTAKAVSVLLTNSGSAADYQGWDLVRNPAVYKIGVPTLSGTGSESSRTAVLINRERNVKLGINSDYSRFDQVVLDPNLTNTVPREQRFYTAMDTWFHCREYLAGGDREAMTDAFAGQALDALPHGLAYAMDDDSRERIMVASFLGGAACGCTGLVHPFSAGLGTVLGVRHGLANCVAMAALEDLVTDLDMSMWLDFQLEMKASDIELPKGLCADLDEGMMERLYRATVVHEKPLRNALGDGWREVLTKEKVGDVFRRM